MESITYDALLTTVVVILAICGAANIIGSTVKLFRDWKKPKNDTFAEIGRRLDEGKTRLDAHDKAINALRDGQKYMCEGVVALLNHELHNGNSAEMQKASNDLNQWLINR